MRKFQSTLATLIIFALAVLFGCQESKPAKQIVEADDGTYIEIYEAIKPALTTDKVPGDTDDPAVWIHPEDSAKSLILGTDKGDEDEGIEGGLYVFDLSGKLIREKSIVGLNRPNNVDVEYGFKLGNEMIDLAIVTQRDAGTIRIFQVPQMRPIDNGGINVFVGDVDSLRRPMGVGVYKRPSDNAFFAILSRKEGPSGAYLWQYRLEDGGNGHVTITKVREFGLWSGAPSEIEAIVVDDELGYVYCSDELLGIRKYHADPEHPDANKQLAIFGTDKFDSDREGLSIYCLDDSTGYILVSDQQADKFHLFRREGEPHNPHEHVRVKVVKVSTSGSDGCETISIPLNERFPAGLFIAMSETKDFHLYSWLDIAGDDLSFVVSPSPSRFLKN